MTDLPTGMSLIKPSMLKVIGYFIVYIIMHLTIGWVKEMSIKKLKEEPTNQEYISDVINTTLLFKYFPIFYVVIILGILMFVGI